VSSTAPATPNHLIPKLPPQFEKRRDYYRPNIYMLATEHAVPLKPAFFTLAIAVRTAGLGIIAAPEKLFGA
jgi:hypothetical protein